MILHDRAFRSLNVDVEQFSLLESLGRIRQRDCTKDRDRFYAILGIGT